MAAEASFGHAIRKEFMLEEGTVFLDHGAYGSMPRCVHERQVRYLAELEANPERWFRYNGLQYLRTAIAKLAAFMGVQPEDTFMMQNVTKAANTVLKTFPLKAGDAVLINSLSYMPVNIATRAAVKRTKGATVHIMDIEFPIVSEDSIVEKYERFMAEHQEVKLVIVDHITSPTSVVLPVKRLTEVCHRHGAVVFVDAAHVPGHLSPDIANIDADFYACNLHKWLFCPRASAFIWMNPHRKHEWFRPLITSALDNFSINDAFAYEGTKDDTPYFCVIDGLEFFNRIGCLHKIRAYCSTLREQGVRFLEEKWETKRLDVPSSMQAPYQCMVELPFIRGFSDASGRYLELKRRLFEEYGVVVTVGNVSGKLMARVSLSVYNTMRDFEQLAECVLDMARKEAITN